MKPKFFPTLAAWRAWLEKHHQDHDELLVGFYKKDSGKPSINGLSPSTARFVFGWIDGVRRRIDEVSYSIRFTPRRPRSIWSAVNIKRVEELKQQGLMWATGIQAFEARQEYRSRIYAFEQQSIQCEASQERRFKANAAAWKFFRSQSPSYQRVATWWAVSAKREETKEKRLERLIEDSKHGRRAT